MLAELRVNMEMGAADQGPSALGSAAAERHKSSQHQDGKVLHPQNDSRVAHPENIRAVTVDTTGTLSLFEAYGFSGKVV